MTTRDEMINADFDEITADMARDDVLRLIDGAAANLLEIRPTEVTPPSEKESITLAPGEVLRMISRAARSLLGENKTATGEEEI